MGGKRCYLRCESARSYSAYTTEHSDNVSAACGGRSKDEFEELSVILRHAEEAWHPRKK